MAGGVDVPRLEPEPPSTAARLATELGLGVLSGALGAGGGYLLGSVLPCSGGYFLNLCSFNGPFFGFMGWFLGGAPGVWMGGRWMGGEGRLGMALLGSVVSLVSLPLALSV
jgi:hypothetical protein